MKAEHIAGESSAGSCIDGGQNAFFESENLSKAGRFAKHQTCQSQYVVDVRLLSMSRPVSVHCLGELLGRAGVCALLSPLLAVHSCRLRLKENLQRSVDFS